MVNCQDYTETHGQQNIKKNFNQLGLITGTVFVSYEVLLHE